MPSHWEDVKKTVKGGLSDAAATTKKYFKIGKGKLDVMNLNNSLNDTFREIGSEVYSQIIGEIKGDIRNNPKVKGLIEKVNQLKQSIKDEQREIDVIKEGAAPLTKTEKDAKNPTNVMAKKAV